MKRIVLIFMILMASVSVLGGCVKNVPSIDHSGEIVIPEPKEEDKKVIGFWIDEKDPYKKRIFDGFMEAFNGSGKDSIYRVEMIKDKNAALRSTVLITEHIHDAALAAFEGKLIYIEDYTGDDKGVTEFFSRVREDMDKRALVTYKTVTLRSEGMNALYRRLQQMTDLVLSDEEELKALFLQEGEAGYHVILGEEETLKRVEEFVLENGIQQKVSLSVTGYGSFTEKEIRRNLVFIALISDGFEIGKTIASDVEELGIDMPGAPLLMIGRDELDDPEIRKVLEPYLD